MSQLLQSPLSQLENGKAENPSPHWLHKLAEFYDVPYESLMEAAGYLRTNKKKTPKSVSAIGAALMSAEFTEEEEKEVINFIGYLRSRPRKE